MHAGQFDVALEGPAWITTHEPYTAVGLTPGEDRSAGRQLQPAAYDLPSGHRLALVINSRDKLYSAADPIGATTTISSPDGAESALDLPLG